jgi:Cu(I)/Ag(I) efflux system membrane protein CusA/SilA
MIKRIIEFSAKNRFLVVLVFIVLMIGAMYSVQKIPLDALPDLSDTQVIIYSRWDRSPDIMEDQVTYPIITSLLGAPKVKSIRGFSDFGYSYVYVIFEDGTDIYWARSRTLEYLSKIQSALPEGVKSEIGPDATSVGWIYQYALVDETGNHDLSELRSYQDWNLKFQLQSLEGVAEVASVGGFVKQYQVQIDPNALAAYNIPITKAIEAIRKSNNETGGRLLEINGREYMVRGCGYIKNLRDIENIGVGLDPQTGTPVTMRQLGRVSIGPDMRRGVVDLDGKGDAVGGIVIMRQGENALNVINRVKAKLKDLEPTLPQGMKVATVYDRSDLIHRSIETLKGTLFDEMLIVSFVILLFLWHIPSATVAIMTIPVSVFLAFIPLMLMGLTSNIMSLAGIAISIGVLVDGAIIEVENAYKRIEQWNESGRTENFFEVRLRAMKEVGPSVFFSLLVIAVAFLPIFTLIDQEGRLFKPLAYAKNFAMAIAAILAITLDPAVRMMFSRYNKFSFNPPWLSKAATMALVGKYYPEEKHPVSRILFRIYEPVCRFALRYRYRFLGGAVLMMVLTIPVFLKLGSEFMPPLNEGTLLYMPTTLPGISVGESERLLQIQDRIIRTVPEVERVFGKAGRANSSTDPAPFSMIETVITLKPENQWRHKDRWYSFLPSFIHPLFRPIWSDHFSLQDVINDLDRRIQIPGWTNAWTMPIKARIDMLSTGIRTPVGIKVQGADLKEIEKTSIAIEQALKDVPGTRSAFAERVVGGYFIDFEIRRDQIIRYGLTVEDAGMIVSSAIGGENLTTTVEGRERYSVNLRYARDYRGNIEKLKRALITTPSGAHIPIGLIADVRIKTGPSMIRDENGLLTGYVYIDVADRDIGGYVDEAKKIVAKKVQIAPGYSLTWSGQYENMERVKSRLKIVLPVTLFLIFLLIYMNTKSGVKTGIILLAVPFSLIGAVWLLFILGYNVSIAVWVGMIALMGLDAETGSFMLLFLDMSWNEYKQKGLFDNRSLKKNLENLTEAIIHGAVKRVRPKIMTVGAAMLGLMPIMWSMGTGSDVMKRIAAPMVGGLVTSFALELLIYPVLFAIWKERELKK